MDCLYGFASSISRDLVCGAINQLLYPCCFNNFVEELEKEKGNLIVTRDSVQKFVEHSTRQTRKPNEIVDKWLQDANIDVDKVNELLEEARTRKNCCFEHSPNWIWRYRLGKKLANKTRDLEKFIKKGGKYSPLDRIVTLPSDIIDSLLEKCMNFESREHTNEELMEALKHDEVAMIGLYGMGGCGKTTLAMEVRKKAETEHLFDKVLFVPVSSTVDVRRIQEKIASSIQYTTFPENEESERAQRLCMQLRKENKILLILDDVWEKLDFGAIGIPSFEHHKGCKVLITTRSEDVCTSMDCQRKIFLPILHDEEAWALFQKKSLISEATADTIKKLAREISNRCKGLPVAIAAVASSLKGKVEVTWKVALNKLKSSQPFNIEKGLRDPYKCLELSYYNLDTEEAKSLLLLCSVFPEDYEISIELLTRCAIGLGVVGEVRSYDEARSEVIATKIKLVSSCLLLHADDKRVKMHDLVRDVTHLIAKRDNKVIKCELEKDVTLEETSIRYLWCAKYPNDLDCSNLEFLCICIKRNLEEFDGIFKRMVKLKVLILDNEEEVELSLSKLSFKTLKNLRFLFLRGFEMTDISFVSDMKKLQGLSLHSCSLPSIFELQTDVIVTQLPNLKLLELRECDMKRTNFDLMERIPRLEELYIIDMKGEWRASSENTIEFFNTFSVPQALQRYGIVFESYLFDSYRKEEFCSDHSTLLLPYFDISNVAIKGLAKKAKELWVANIQGGAKNIIPDIFQIEEGGMNEMNKLEIRDSEEIECLVDTTDHLCQVGTLFSKLHTLRICDMKHIRALWHGCLPPGGTFQKLENLYLRDCPFLTYLFTYAIAQSLVQLKILKILGCDELKHIVADDDKTEKSEDELKIGHHVQSPIFQNLQEVVVFNCGKLKHVFSAGIVGGLPQLKVLYIRDCSDLDKIIEDIVPSAYEDKKEVDEIIWDPHVESTSVSFIVKHSSGSFTLSNLASLAIASCPKLGSLFMASAAKTITSLEYLYIWDCHGLKHIITHEAYNQKENIVEDDAHDFQTDISMFKSLKLLEIRECDLLQHIFPVPFVGGPMKLNDQQQNNSQIELHALEELDLRRIPKSIITDNYDVRCPSLGKLSLVSIGRYVGFFTINASKAGQSDYIIIKISNSDSLHSVGSLQYPSKQPQGLNLLIMHNIRKIELKGFDKIKYLLNLSVASSMLLETLEIKECPGLEYIIDTGDGYDGENWDAIFPNLKRLFVRNCGQLEYMFGQYPLDNQDCKEIHFHFPALEQLDLENLPIFVSICANNSLSVTWPSLEEIRCDGCSCSQLLNDSISTSNKDSEGIQNPFLTLSTLVVRNANIEGIGQQVSLRLEYLKLENLPLMTNIWVASKNSFTLQRLNRLIIKGCAKLEVIFPPAVLRCLPELKRLEIKNCKELKQMINEEEVEDKNLSNLVSPKPCFPKLALLVVEECHKLKRLFPASASASNDLPNNLEVLILNRAIELEELIGFEQVKGDRIGKANVELPKLNLLIFIHLPKFRQEIEPMNVKHLIVHNCPKLSVTSTTTPLELEKNIYSSDLLENTGLYSWEIRHMIDQINEYDEISRSSSTSELASSQENNPIPETTSFEMNQDHPSTSKSKSPSSQVNDSNQSIMGNIAEMVHEHIESGALVSEMASHLQSLEQKLLPISSSNMTKLADEESNNEAGFPNQHALAETMNIEEIGKNSKKGATVKTLSSGRNTLGHDFQVFEQDHKLNEGLNLMDKQEGISIVSNNNIDVSSASVDICSRLAAYKHFSDLDEPQIALLAEAIASYPHLWNACKKSSERFQVFMLKTLAEILFFLRNETAISITPQTENEFQRLCDVAVQLGFERSWVDEMRQRVVASNPELDNAQARIKELLERRNHLTQELQDIQNELKILNDFVEAQTKCFNFL